MAQRNSQRPAQGRGAMQVEPIMRIMEVAFDPAYGEAWNNRQIRDALLMPSTHAILISSTGEMIENGMSEAVGFVLSRYAAGEEELLLIAVAPSSRHQGLGEQLINHLFEASRARGATRIYLEMRRGNPAENLYRKVGFEPIGERRNYYRMADGRQIDAITFGRSI